MGTESKKGGWFQVLGGALLLLMAVEVVVLMRQNEELKRQLETLGHPMKPLARGERVQPIEIESLDGTSLHLSYDDSTREYLFFVLSTGCPHCEKNLAAWNSLAARASQSNWYVVGICINSLEETRRYAEAKGPQFYMVSVARDTSFERKYGINQVPETILIGGNGVIRGVWIGELSREQTNEINELIRQG